MAPHEEEHPTVECCLKKCCLSQANMETNVKVMMMTRHNYEFVKLKGCLIFCNKNGSYYILTHL